MRCALLIGISRLRHVCSLGFLGIFVVKLLYGFKDLSHLPFKGCKSCSPGAGGLYYPIGIASEWIGGLVRLLIFVVLKKRMCGSKEVV